MMICQAGSQSPGSEMEFVGGNTWKEQALIRECRRSGRHRVGGGGFFMDVVHEYPDLTVHLTPSTLIAKRFSQKLDHGTL